MNARCSENQSSQDARKGLFCQVTISIDAFAPSMTLSDGRVLKFPAASDWLYSLYQRSDFELLFILSVKHRVAEAELDVGDPFAGSFSDICSSWKSMRLLCRTGWVLGG